MRNYAAANVVQSHGTVHVIDVQLSFNIADHDIAIVDGMQRKRSPPRDGNGQVHGALNGIDFDYDFIVFGVYGEACGRLWDPSHAATHALCSFRATGMSFH